MLLFIFSLRSNGLNSILDLGDNSNNVVNQKSLITSPQWEKMKNLWSKNINWKPLDNKIIDSLKEIEKVIRNIFNSLLHVPKLY